MSAEFERSILKDLETTWEPVVNFLNNEGQWFLDSGANLAVQSMRAFAANDLELAEVGLSRAADHLEQGHLMKEAAGVINDIEKWTATRRRELNWGGV